MLQYDFFEDGRRYSFDVDGSALKITAGGRSWAVPVRESDFVIKINKRSIGAAGGAAGLYGFIERAIRENFMTAWVNIIIKSFCR